MKTVLFFYNDLLLRREVCDAYITPSDNVKNIIEWRTKCLSRELKEGYLASLKIKVIDKLDVTMIN